MNGLGAVITNFDNATEADKERAKMRAQDCGWKRQGFYYVHPSGRRYLTKDMDGWIDLCDNEGIE